ncbi:Calpain-type cysteine protease ADL1 [Diplonema papillatum]|nr:Calpain-type cysteine protease ADL1 [Diplonema papillatum]
MVEYVGMSVQDVYRLRCKELGCKANSLLLKELPSAPDKFTLVKSLDLSKNFVGPKGLLPVLEIVKVSPCLHHLDLRDNQLTNQCVSNVADVLQAHKGIVSLDLSSNPITISAGKAILELVRVNTQIKEVGLDGTAVRDMQLRAVEAQLRKNHAAAHREVYTEQAAGGALDVVDAADVSMAEAVGLMSVLPVTVNEMLFDENPIDRITGLCARHKARFADPQFATDWKAIHRSALKDFGVVSWRRAPNVFEKTTVLPASFPFIEPADCVIGAANTTWLMESLAAAKRGLSETGADGDKLEDMITPKTLSPYGVYTVKLFVDGKWRWVVIDDYVPVDADGWPIFSRMKADTPAAGSLWIILMEKAMAKIHGSYQAIDQSVRSTHPGEKAPCVAAAVVGFTGGAGITRDVHQDDFDSEAWWAELVDLSGQGALLVGTTSSSGDRGRSLAETGLLEDHAYSILSVRGINGHRLLRLSSPYQSTTWLGPWHAGSTLWDQHPDIRHALPRDNPDTTFWMPYSAFIEHLSAVHIVKTYPNWAQTLIPGEWSAATAGGPYFEQTWGINPRFKLNVQKTGNFFINLFVPDRRFSNVYIDTMAFHLLKADYYPITYDKDNVVVKTPYLITDSVSYEGTLEQGIYWLVPSTYVAGKVGAYYARIMADTPFVVQHEKAENYWREAVATSKWTSSGEYQNGEDHPQFELCIQESPDPARLLITVDLEQNDDHCIVVFVCAGDGSRVLGAIPDDRVLVKSKYLIGSTVQLSCMLPGGDIRYVIVPCLQPEGSRSSCTVTVLCSVPKVTLNELPMWSQKEAAGKWEKSSTYQDATGNPQFELVCPVPGQQFVVKLEVSGHDDPSILFFIIANGDQYGKGLSGLIPESSIVCTSTYIRARAIVKDFKATDSGSFIIVPTLQPPGL